MREERDNSKWLTRVAGYLRSKPRMLLHFQHQEPSSHLTATVDKDFAGCPRTRKSANGGYITLGCHMIKSWSITQTVVAMSSVESEYYGLVKGGCEGIGVSGLVCDLTGRDLQTDLETGCGEERRREGPALGGADLAAVRIG